MIRSTIPLEQHQKEITTLQNQIDFLTEQLDWLKRQLFGQKAEKFAASQNSEQMYFEGFDKLTSNPPEKRTVAEHTRKKSQRNGKDKITLPSDLPIERQVIDLPEEQKICSQTGKPLVKMARK